MTNGSEIGIVQEASWPESLPQNEEWFFSVCVRVKSMHWALHKGVDGDFGAKQLWKTPLAEHSACTQNPAEYLASFLTQASYNYVFGKGVLPTTDNVKEIMKLRKHNPITVYIIRANDVSDEKVKALSCLWVVPCRQIILKQKDVIPSFWKTIKVSDMPMLLMLYGAGQKGGYPMFLVSTDEIISFIGCDSNRKVLSEGNKLPIETDEAVNKTKEAAVHWATLLGESNGSGLKDIYVTGERRMDVIKLLEVSFEEAKLNCSVFEENNLVQLGLSTVLMDIAQGGGEMKNLTKGPLKVTNETKVTKVTNKTNVTNKTKVTVTNKRKVTNKTKVINKTALKSANVKSDGLPKLMDKIEAKSNCKISQALNTSGPGPKLGIEKEFSRSSKRIKSESTTLNPKELLKEHSKTVKEKKIIPSVKEQSKVPIEKDTKLVKVQSKVVIEKDKDPRSFIGRRVAKKFSSVVYLGAITSYNDDSSEDNGLWHVKYDDGDEEDFNLKELRKAMNFHEKNMKKSKNKK